MRITVIVPTLGRAAIVRPTVQRLAQQTRLPDRVIVVGVTPADVQDVNCPNVVTDTAFAPAGLCSQRNRGLALAHGTCDLVIFFDDDYVAADDFLARAEALFAANADIVGANGRIIADGINGAGYTFEEAVALVLRDRASPPGHGSDSAMEALYGCNMVFRTAALEGLRFDENLPMYGWQEDIDFSYQVGRRGRLVKHRAMAGVHMGIKISRSPGRRLGYSQIANPIYLARKRTMPCKMAWNLMVRNLGANILGSFRPEPFVDRRGRLAGNLMAIGDAMTGKVDPRRILTLN